jgi:hypothetical protein
MHQQCELSLPDRANPPVWYHPLASADCIIDMTGNWQLKSTCFIISAFFDPTCIRVGTAGQTEIWLNRNSNFDLPGQAILPDYSVNSMHFLSRSTFGDTRLKRWIKLPNYPHITPKHGLANEREFLEGSK